MHDTGEPDHDINHRACLILELPVLSDEAALQLSELLQQLTENFDAHHDQPIRRAHRARLRKYERLCCEQRFLDRQQPLPFEDIPF